MRMIILSRERRNWGVNPVKNYMTSYSLERRKSNNVTRRYLVIVDQPEIQEMMKKEFEVYPHEYTCKDFFYCIAQTSFRREKEFIKAIIYKLKKSNLGPKILNPLEILGPKEEILSDIEMDNN